MLTQNMIFMDFGIISKDKNKSLFAGKRNGREYAKEYNLLIFSDKPLLHLIVPDKVVISGSFYFGLLQNYFHCFENKEELYNYITYNREYYEKNKVSELERSINRAFSFEYSFDY